VVEIHDPGTGKVRLRGSIDRAVPTPVAATSRRALLKGFALGSVVSAAAAAEANPTGDYWGDQIAQGKDGGTGLDHQIGQGLHQGGRSIAADHGS